MCLWFACLGMHHDDVTYVRPHRGLPATKPLDDRLPAAQGNGYYNHGNGHYGNGAHHQMAADEAGHKAYNDARKGPAVAYRDAPPAYAGAAVRQPPAWNNGRVAEAAGHGNGAQQQQQNYRHYYERQPVHREDAMDHRYSTTTATATTDQERY